MKTEKKHITIYIFALCDVFYDAFYIKGLEDYFETSVCFNVSKFPNFKQGTFAVIIEDSVSETRLILDSKDSNIISNDELAWCDVYGKVNYKEESVPFSNENKVLAIGPSFGIKIWNFSESLFFGFTNYLKFNSKITNKREFLANYYRQYKRLRLENYKCSTKGIKNYVFFVGTIWRNENDTNLFRSYFIRACQKNKNIDFEGGFAPRNDGQNMGFENLLTNNRYPFKEYIEKTKKSNIVFNTPAVLSCHGWKLGEFLAMGKAIISTHHINILPSPLNEKEHIFYVENDLKSFEEKVNFLINSDSERMFLEKNSRKYFETFLSPEKVIEKLYRATL